MFFSVKVYFTLAILSTSGSSQSFPTSKSAPRLLQIIDFNTFPPFSPLNPRVGFPSRPAPVSKQAIGPPDAGGHIEGIEAWKLWMNRRLASRCPSDLYISDWDVVNAAELFDPRPLFTDNSRAYASSTISHGLSGDYIRNLAGTPLEIIKQRWNISTFEDLSLDRVATQIYTELKSTADVVGYIVLASLGIIVSVVALLSLCSGWQHCRRLYSKLFCSFCCFDRIRPDVPNDYSSLIRWGWTVVAILFVAVLPLVLSSVGIEYSLQFKNDSDAYRCEAVRLPYSVAFGVQTADQTSQARALGYADGLKGIEPWKGLVNLRKRIAGVLWRANPEGGVGTLQADVYDAYNATRSLIALYSYTQNNAIDRVERAISIAQSRINPDTHHVWLLGRAFEEAEAQAAISKVRAGLSEMSQTLERSDATINAAVGPQSASLKAASAALGDILSVVVGVDETLMDAVKHSSLFDDTADDISGMVTTSMVIGSLLPGAAVIVFIGVLLFIGVSYRKKTVLSEVLVPILMFEFGWLGILGGLLLAAGALLMLGAAILSQPCSFLYKDLLESNLYLNYPALIDSFSWLLNESPEHVADVLGAVGTLKGNGDVIAAFQLESYFTTVKLAVDETEVEMKRMLASVKANLTDSRLREIDEIVEGYSWLVVPNFQEALDDPLVQAEFLTYPEVVFSGVQEATAPLSQRVLDDVRKQLPDHIVDFLTPEAINSVTKLTGLADFNGVLERALSNPELMLPPAFRRWCLEYRPGVCGDKPGVIVRNDFGVDATKNANLMLIKSALRSTLGDAVGDLEYIKFENAIRWGVRKLSFLKSKPFVSVMGDRPWKEESIIFEEFAAPLVNNWVSGQLALLHSDIDGVVENLDEFESTISHLLHDVWQMVLEVKESTNSKSLLYQTVTSAEPVCKGMLGDIAVVGIVWLTIGLVQLVGWVLMYKLWHYLVNTIDTRIRLQQEYESKQQELRALEFAPFSKLRIGNEALISTSEVVRCMCVGSENEEDDDELIGDPEAQGGLTSGMSYGRLPSKIVAGSPPRSPMGV